MIKITNKLKFTFLLILTLYITSCTETEDKECETETVCFGDGSCIERPINIDDCF